MGQLADAIKAYKLSPDNSPAEREAKEIITRITESEWWKTEVGTEFKWPVKAKYKWRPFGFPTTEYTYVGNFIVPNWDYDATMALLTKGKEKP